jgi:hypothetical protein
MKNVPQATEVNTASGFMVSPCAIVFNVGSYNNAEVTTFTIKYKVGN